jgi:hypothetical protein
LSVQGRKAAAELPAANINVWNAGAFARGGDAALELHEPTVRVVQQLRRARVRLEQAKLPELRLNSAIRALWRTEMRLDRPLRLAVLGEINAGKSSLANLLAGIESLPTAVICNTTIPTLLYYAREPEVFIAHHDGRRERLKGDRAPPQRSIFRVEVGLPSARLRALQILDLPGLTDARAGGPEVDLALHRVDAAIWCTMSTQAWKESERVAWSMLPARLHRRGILVSTHCDLLREAADRHKLLDRLREDVGTSFRSIVLLSTIEALGAMGGDRQGPAGATWLASGAETLGADLASLLSELRDERAAAALRMTSRIAQRALSRIDGRRPGALTSTR